MPELIKDLAIKGYRGLSDLSVRGFGRVNLITGKNNSGKSTILECIRLLVTGGSIQTFKDIMDYREESASSGDGDRIAGPFSLSPLSNLFNGCPDLHAPDSFFSISAEGGLPSPFMNLSARIGWFVRNLDSARQVMSFEPVAPDLFEDVGESFPALDLSIAGRKRVIPLDRFVRRMPNRIEPDPVTVPCVYLDPFSSRSTYQLGALWDAIALTDAEQEVVRALKVVSHDIEAVSMIGSDDRGGRGRTAIAKSKRFASPVPLRTFGDGVNRLFGVVLSLCNARNGILLVDEIENGLHYSVQEEIWGMIFRLSKELNVQVFATSHSWDCVNGFQSAAIESPQDGVLLRITKRDGEVIPTRFSEAELAIVSRDKIEVR